jgi:ABC-type glycerol-3-phosphate transport system substrate-binding protein
MTVFAVVAVALLILPACGPAPTPEVVEKEVEVTIEVEKEVEVTVEVEKEVVKEVEKEVEVTVEVVVDPTACNLEPPESAATIDYIGWTFPVMDFYAEELEKCNKVDNLEVNTQMLDGTTATEQQRLALSAGGANPYEIIHTSDGMFPEYVGAGWLLPLDDLVEKYREEYDLDDIDDLYWEKASYQGKIYGIPLVGNTEHMFYRIDLMEKYNLDIPETYDDVIAACEVLKEEDSIELPFVFDDSSYQFGDMFASLRGGPMPLLDEDSMPIFTGEDGVATIEKMHEIIDACMGEIGMTYSIDDMEIGMETGGLAMMKTWASRAANMDDPDKSMFVGGIGFSPCPRMCPDCPHASVGWADYWSIPANTEADPDLIFRVMMEASDFRSQVEASELAIVTRNAVVEAGAGGRYLEAASQSITGGNGKWPDNPARWTAHTALDNWLPRIFAGELTPQEGLDGAAEEYIREATAQGYID